MKESWLVGRIVTRRVQVLGLRNTSQDDRQSQEEGCSGVDGKLLGAEFHDIELETSTI